VRGRLRASLDGEIEVAEALVAKRRPDALLVLETLRRVKAGELTASQCRAELFAGSRRDPAPKIQP
jgi:hypothetical protein